MGQIPSTNLSQDVRNRVKGFKVDEILGSERLLKQATTNTTTAYADFRFKVVKTRDSNQADEGEEAQCRIGALRFWHLGQVVDCAQATVHQEDSEETGLETIFSENGGSWECEEGYCLQIRFEHPVAVSEFAFRMHDEAHEYQDLLQFKIEAKKNGEDWLTLWESDGVDFATPSRRGVWAPRVELGDKAVSVETAGAKHKDKFAEATEKYAGAALQGWLAGQPTGMAPCAQTRALMECCKAQIVGESQRRREALFSMLYSTSEAAVTEAELAAAAQRLRARAAASNASGGSGIASLTASCATRLIFESGLQGPQGEVMLNMLNDHISANVAGLDLPPAVGELPGPLSTALDTASTVCREQLKCAMTPMAGIRDTLGHAFRNSDIKGSEKVEFNLLKGLLIKAGDLNDVESSKLIETARESLGIRAEEKLVNYHDFLDWLCVDNGRASKRLSGITKAKYQSPKVAEFLLRLAGLRGSLGDALAVANWLAKANPDANLDGLWKGAETLFSLLSAWSREYYDEEKEWTNHKTVNAAIRCYAPASGQAIRNMSEGTYAEVRLEAGASKSRIGFVPIGAAWKESGIGLQNGMSWADGTTGPLEESNLQRGLMDGDVVGLHMIRGRGIELYINGMGVGRLPWHQELEVKGCHLCVCELHSQAEVFINIGQAPFEFPVAGAVSWCKTTGHETFEEARAKAMEDAGGKANATALGILITRTMARNCATMPAGKGQTASSKKVFESAHPYNNNTHQKYKVEIPNAKSYKITWDPRTRMENECDYVSFYLDEDLTKQVGKAKYTAGGGPGSQTCPELTIEAEKFWFLFHTDGSQVDWGWKMNVEAELKATSSNYPLKVQADGPTVQLLSEMVQSSNNTAISDAALVMIPRHINLAGGELGESGEATAAALLGLAREKGDRAIKGAQAFGDCCAALLGSPEGLLRAQLELWASIDKYNPEALSILSSNIANADMPFGSMVDNPDTTAIVKKLVEMIKKDPSNSRVPKLLWRLFTDAVAYLVAGRSKRPADGWSMVLENMRQVFELGANIKDADFSSSSRPSFLMVLVMPALHGLAMIPSLAAAKWDDVVGLLPSVGALFAKGAAYPPLRTAALALITTLGYNLVSLGSKDTLEDPAAKDALKVLQSPLLRAIPTTALGKEYTGAPIGVQMVEKTIGTKLSVTDAGMKANPVLQEMMDQSTQRAQELVSFLETAEPNPQKAFFPPNMHNLIFCLLASRFHAVEALNTALSDMEAGKGMTQQAITQIWGQARRLGFPWLVNVKQRLTAAGRASEQALTAMEESVRMLVSCEPPEAVTDPGEDDGLSAMWEQQGMLGGVDFSDTQPLSPKWGSVPKQLKDLKRLGLLMKPIPSGVNHLPAQQIREFFDSQWIEKDNPVEFLLKGIRANSIAVWRRAAGISLLAWAVNTCTDGAEPWVAAMAMNTLGKAWEDEAAFSQSSAEVPAVTALAVARRYALESTVRFLVAAGDGRPEGPALQVMSLSALAGPWHSWDQNIAVAANVFGAVHPHLPWVGAPTPKDKKTLRQLRGHAARLALESLFGLVHAQKDPGSSSPLLTGMLEELYTDLGALQVVKKKNDDDDNEGLSLKALFGADATEKPEKKKSEAEAPNINAESIVEDLRRRLHAGEDFGDFPEEYWEGYLEMLKDALREWGGDSGQRSISDLGGEEDSDSSDDEGGIRWQEFDANGDGYIDRFEVLRAWRKMMGVEGNESPAQMPPGVPRFAGDTGETRQSESEEEDAGPPCFLQTLVIPKAAGVPTTALLMSLDGVLRLCEAMGIGGNVHCANESCEKIIQLTSGGKQEALFSLSILRHKPDIVPEALVGKACGHLLDGICGNQDPGWLRGVDATIAHQRASVLREWLVTGGLVASQQAKDAVLAALDAGGNRVLGAMYVLGSAPLSHALCSARVLRGNHLCTIVDATATGPVWQFHPHMDSPGNDIEHVGTLPVAELKEKCLEKKGVCFNTDGWIKRVLLDSLSYWTDDDNRGLYVLKHKNAPVSILRADGTGMAEAAAGSLEVLGAEANLTTFSAEALTNIVDATSAFGMEESAKFNHLNWALRAVLRQSPDAVEHFVAAGGLKSWMGTVFKQAWPGLEDMSASQRSSVAASIRLEFPKQFKKGAKLVFSPKEPEKEKEYGEEEKDEAKQEEKRKDAEAAKKAGNVVALAMGVLGMTAPPASEDSKPGVPSVAELIPVVRSSLSQAPSGRVMRVVGLLPDEPPAVAEDRMGMVDGSPNKLEASQDCPVTAIMESVRKDKESLEKVAAEAAAWEHHALAVDICLSSVLQLSKRPGGAEKLAQVPADQMARLCVEFSHTLSNDSQRAEARAAMLSLARQNAALATAVQELAMAHLVGSLGVLPGSGKAKSATQYESEHPYQNYTDKREDVVFPGARRIIITFNQESTTEENCDWIDFTAPTMPNAIRRTGGPDGRWTEITIEGDRFSYHWHTDHSCTRWGWIFTCKPVGLPPAGAFADGPKLDAAVYLTEFVLDLVPDVAPAQVLRPELAAVLLGLTEMCFNTKLVDNLQRFISLCDTHSVVLDWAGAAQTLQSLIQRSQAANQKDALAAAITLRLALPEVKVPQSAPRFKQAQGVYLSEQDQVCISRSNRKSICYVATKATALCFKRLTNKETWVGLAKGPEANDRIMIRLTDGATCIGDMVEQPAKPVAADQLETVRVQFNVTSSSVSFDGTNGFHVSILVPRSAASADDTRSVVAEGRGGWRFAVRLCELSSGSRVSLPVGISDDELTKLTNAGRAIQAISTYKPANEWPQEFLVPAFLDWYDVCQGVQEPPDGADTLEFEKFTNENEDEEDSSEPRELVVWGAGIDKFNGVYKKRFKSPDAPAEEEEEREVYYENDHGCVLCGKSGFDDDYHSFWEFKASLEGDVVYLSTLQLGQSTDCVQLTIDPAGGAAPWLGTAQNCKEKAIEDSTTISKCTRLPSEEEDAEAPRPDFEVLKVYEFARGIVIFYKVHVTHNLELRGQWRPEAKLGDGTSVHLELLGVTSTGHAAATLDKDCFEGHTNAKLFFSGGDDYSKVLVYRSSKATTATLLERLARRNAKPIESPHPLPAGDRKVMKLSAEGGQGIMMQFNAKSSLPGKMIGLVTQDEAGLRPLRLTRHKTSTVMLSASALKRASDDAARGIISEVKGQSYKVQASECYLHYPLPRPVHWDPVGAGTTIQEASPHPYESNSDVKRQVLLPGAQRLRVQFHGECHTESGYDYLRFYQDEGLEHMLHSFAGYDFDAEVEISGDSFWYTFTSDGGTELWGYEFQVSDAAFEAPLPPGNKVRAVEGNSLTLPASCKVKRAWYGILSVDNFWGTESAKDVTNEVRKLQAKAMGSTVEISASNENFGDPCEGSQKCLLVELEGGGDQDVEVFTQGIHLADDGSMLFEGAGPSGGGWTKMSGHLQLEFLPVFDGSQEEARAEVAAGNGWCGYVFREAMGDDGDELEDIRLVKEGFVASKEDCGGDGHDELQEIHFHSSGPRESDTFYEFFNIKPDSECGMEPDEIVSAEMTVEEAKEKCRAEGYAFFSGPLIDPPKLKEVTFWKQWFSRLEGFARGSDTDVVYRYVPADNVPYIVRTSTEALSWLPSAPISGSGESEKASPEARCKVLAGEVSIDFASAPIEEANLAVGVAVKPRRTLQWPSTQAPQPSLPPAMPAPGGEDVGRLPSLPIQQGEQGSALPSARSLPSEAAQANEDSKEDKALEWWWRCDGKTFFEGGGIGAQQGPWTFGAGDVIGVVALLDGLVLRGLRLTRAGHTISSVIFPQGLELPAVEEGKDHCLELCVGVRKSPACISLSPTPQNVLPVAMPAGGAEPPLSDSEQGSATVVFHALDESKDGSLDRTEIANALGGAREELFKALDSSEDGKVSPAEWLAYCRKVKGANGVPGLGLFLDAFRKKLNHKGKEVIFPDAPAPKEAWGLHVTVTPTDLHTSSMLSIIESTVPSYYKEFIQLAGQSWEQSTDVEIIDYLQNLVDAGEEFEEVKDITPAHLLNPNRREGRRKAVPTVASIQRFLARYSVLKWVNTWIEEKLLPFTDLPNLAKHSYSKPINLARHFLYKKTKYGRFDQIVSSTETSEEGEMCFKRQLKIDCEQAEECDIDGTKMLFGQASVKAENFSNTLFRSRAPNYNRIIRVSYEGEDGVDQGGLYRDFLDAISTELMSSYLPLFIPTPNGRDNKGECREAWTLAPGKPSQAAMRMLTFLGRMMSICVRRGDVIPLSLSAFTWKLLIGDTPTLVDLEKADVNTAQSLRQFMDVESLGVTEDDFSMVFGDMFFVYPNSANEIVPLCEGGATKPVTFNNAPEFARAVLEMRINEAAESIAVIRAGLAGAVPIGCFSLWQYQDLEFRVCGNPNIDLAALRNHVRYDGFSETDDQIKFLWEALEQFEQKDLQFFIRFCWGRSRLPPEGSNQWLDGFKVSRGSDIPPTGLPRAHTCFFQIDLPMYTSTEQTKERLLYAARNCVSMLNS